MSRTPAAPSSAERRSFDAFRRDVLRGLALPDKALLCKYFYDQRGSELFDQICRLEEYYPTRCELEILRRRGPDMARRIGPSAVLIEYGSGSGVKTRRLLRLLERPAAYVPVDISGEHLDHSARRLQQHFGGLAVLPVCADFSRPFAPPPLPAGRRVVYFSGSTIGNFHPPEAQELLAGIARLCGPGGGLLIGVDLKKDRQTLERAYNDRLGVTAAFNLNLLARINRELGGDFDLGRFAHRAFYDEAAGRIEMHLDSLAGQTVHVGGRAFAFRQGEGVHTECSYKYGLEEFAALAATAGLRVEAVWTDAAGLYSVQYLAF
jgi:dimethylhistidine N-methyltransferase